LNCNSFGIIKFGPFAPDQPDLMNRGAEVALNVLPRSNYYERMPSVEPFSGDSAGSRILGAITGLDSIRTKYLYIGIENAIKQVTPVGFIDVSRSGGYVGADSWDFCSWGDLIIGVTLQDQLQSISVGSPNFEDLTTENIKARRCAIIRSQLFVGDVEDDDGYNANRIRWSALRNPRDFVIAPETLSDFQDLKASSGGVQRIFGGEFGLVFTENDVWRASWIGAPAAWQIEKVDSDLGLFAPGAAVQHGGRVYFISEDGFFMTNGNPSDPIGTRKVNRTFLEALNYEHVDRITSALFVGEQTIVWAFPTSTSVNGVPNRLIMYNYRNNTWAEGDEVTELLFSATTPYVPIDEPSYFSSTGLYPTLKDVPYSLDSPFWAGSGKFLASATADHRIGFFTGPSREATLETGEMQLSPGYRSFIQYCRPTHESSLTRPRVYLSIGHRNRQSDDVVYTPERQEDENGIIPFRLDSRYARFKIRIEGDFGQGIGVEVFGRQSGGR
jgi:hypothetical protein